MNDKKAYELLKRTVKECKAEVKRTISKTDRPEVWVLNKPAASLKDYLLLAVDPGVESGWAIFQTYRFRGCGTFRPFAKCPALGGERGFEERFQDGIDFYALFLERMIKARMEDGQHSDPIAVVIEQPDFASEAASQRGDLAKLNRWVGAFCEMALGHGVETYLAPVNRWKGQLSKKQVENRVLKCTAIDEAQARQFKSHAIDAVGIAQWTRGLMP